MVKKSNYVVLGHLTATFLTKWTVRLNCKNKLKREEVKLEDWLENRSKLERIFGDRT